MTRSLEHQRLDKFLWCARFAATRTACAAMAESGLVRINRLPTDKPHARIRVGDVLTLPLHAGVRVIEVLALAERRGPAAQARDLYRSRSESGERAGVACAGARTPPYRATGPNLT
jgi:ribosome-associated heat shock protein Hsp15